MDEAIMDTYQDRLERECASLRAENEALREAITEAIADLSDENTWTQKVIEDLVAALAAGRE